MVDATQTSVEGRDPRSGRQVSVSFREGVISSVQDLGPGIDSSPWLGPGLVDLQINGCAGFDFNGDAAGIALQEAGRYLLRHGITTFFPTFITRDPEDLTASLREAARSTAIDGLLGSVVPGFHLEGPFISPEDGPRGAHDKRFVREPDWYLFESWQEAADGHIRIITLSPEWPAACDFIQSCTRAGVIAAIGHTSASPEQIRDAVSAGAILASHLGNGTHLLLPRHPNYLWEQLADDRLWASVIADGAHLPVSFLKVVIRAKGERAIVVSDAVRVLGLTDSADETPVGSHVVLTRDGRLVLRENPDLLAGSSKLLPYAIGHLVSNGVAGLAEAWDMCSVRPAALAGLPVSAGVSVGAPADITLLELDSAGTHARRVYKNGNLVSKD